MYVLAGGEFAVLPGIPVLHFSQAGDPVQARGRRKVGGTEGGVHAATFVLDAQLLVIPHVLSKKFELPTFPLFEEDSWYDAG